MSRPATTILDVYSTCHPERPLEPGDPRYVDLREVRGGEHLAANISRRIRTTDHPNYHQHLITGHRGCGKSTELKHIQGHLEDNELFCVYFDAEDMLDVNDIEYLDVLLTIARVVHERLEEEGISLPEEQLQHLDDWFADVILTETEYEERETALRSEFGVDVNTILLRFLVAATGVLRSGGAQRREVRKRVQRELNVFLQRLNDLLTLAQREIVKTGYEGLVVIVDGLEKVPYRSLGDGQSNHSRFFVQHAEALKKPNCHILYTVPISLKMNQNLGDAFPADNVIPMVTIEPRGKRQLRAVVEKRVSVPDVFEEEADVDRLVDISGGSLRDLLRVIRFACDGADETIGSGEVDRAIQKLVRQYDYQLQTDDLDALVEVETAGRLPSTEASSRLLHQRIVLEYFDAQGRRRHAIHPAVRRIDIVQQALADTANSSSETDD